jgi:hypothetical protein
MQFLKIKTLSKESKRSMGRYDLFFEKVSEYVAAAAVVIFKKKSFPIY